MDAREIIAKLRDGDTLSGDEITWFANGLATGAVSDAQAGAFAMAVLLNGLGRDGRVALTLAMRDSGDVMGWDLPGPAIDKHSTGGVGDSVSLILAPALAACGAYVPMVSGRGLGHTGGTLDKLESIPGLCTDVSEARFHEIVADVGCAIVSATGQIAPADKRLYAIRDVTGTVESIDLITASILSKKLAAGLGYLVLDVKCGSGAFMEDVADAQALARALVETADGAGCHTSALITDMNQPLGRTAGNALEMAECMAIMSGARGGRLAELTCALGGELLNASGQTACVETGAEMIAGTLSSGAALERFGRMVTALGGPPDFADHWSTYLPQASVSHTIHAEKPGFVNAIDTHAMGMAVVHLGGGRLRGGDQIDPAVGLSDIVELGAEMVIGTPIARIHAASKSDADSAARSLMAAIKIGEKAAPGPLIIERINP